MLWLRKLAAVLAIASGVSMFVLPFPDGLTGEREQEVVWLEVELLGVGEDPDRDPAQTVSAADLRPYPALAAAVERAISGEVPAELRTDVDPRELRRFHASVLDGRGDSPRFVVGEHLLHTIVMLEPVDWTLAVPWLPAAARVVGVVALLAGLVLLASGYRVAASRTGIPVAPFGFALFCDLVLIAFGVFAVGVTLDAAWVELVGQPSLLGLEPEWPSDQTFTAIHFVALPALLVALPLMTLFFTSLSSQRVRIDADGVTSLGAIGSTSIRWDEVEEVRLRDQRNPASFTVVDFRRLQQVLELTGGDRCVVINEPTSRSRKRTILDALRTHVPPDKAALIDVVERW